jgi:hypothetical protein
VSLILKKYKITRFAACESVKPYGLYPLNPLLSPFASLPHSRRMASPASASASTSAPFSLSLPVRLNCFLSSLPSSSSVLPRLRVALALARPCAAVLSSLGDVREQKEYYEEDEYEEEGMEELEYDDDDEEEVELVEVGYVSGVHGDVLVTPRTDFPDLRFATVTDHSLVRLSSSLSVTAQIPMLIACGLCFFLLV